MALEIVRTVEALREAVRRRRQGTGGAVGLVPTMGALHDGHLALVARSRELTATTIVTIFVNPTQFAANEDLSRYPRTEEADLARLTEAKADIVYMPTPAIIYPPGFATTVSLEGPATAGLEDRFRPGHFSGVATVVAKLFLQSGADLAVFGEKDWQQLAVVRQMARDLDIAITIVGLPTVREADGLAMSSRNRFLSAQDRARAPLIHETLQSVAAALRAGKSVDTVLEAARATLTAAGFALDYLEARDSTSLAPLLAVPDKPIRLLVAARLGATRLIDNIPV